MATRYIHNLKLLIKKCFYKVKTPLVRASARGRTITVIKLQEETDSIISAPRFRTPKNVFVTFTRTNSPTRPFGIPHSMREGALTQLSRGVFRNTLVGGGLGNFFLDAESFLTPLSLSGKLFWPPPPPRFVIRKVRYSEYTNSFVIPNSEINTRSFNRTWYALFEITDIMLLFGITNVTHHSE